MTLYREGLLNTGGTIAARLHDFDPRPSWLTNLVLHLDTAVYWIHFVGTNFMQPRTLPIAPGSHFPYGYTVDPP